MAYMFLKYLSMEHQLENIWSLFFSFPECCDYWNTLKYFKDRASESWKSKQICRELSPTNAAIIGSFAVSFCNCIIVFHCCHIWNPPYSPFAEAWPSFYFSLWMITLHSYCLSFLKFLFAAKCAENKDISLAEFFHVRKTTGCLNFKNFLELLRIKLVTYFTDFWYDKAGKIV